MNAQTNNTGSLIPPALENSVMEQKVGLSRRGFLRGAALGATVLPAATAVVAATATEQVEVAAEDPKRFLEYSGPGRYRIKDGNDGDRMKVFYVERAPWMDCKTDGRFYKATAVNGDARPRYYTDAGFADFAVRKLSSLEASND